MDSLTLSPVTLEGAGFLYDLLKERDPSINISHRELPTFENHVRFIESKPYECWYIVFRNVHGSEVMEPIGSVYLTRENEIGLFFTRASKGKGYGSRVLNMLMGVHPRKAYIANIAPTNQHSTKFFQARGFKHIQNTYRLDVG